MYEVIRHPHPRGFIRQGEIIVGSVQIPHAGERFVEEFNERYARLDLQIRLPEHGTEAEMGHGRHG